MNVYIYGADADNSAAVITQCVELLSRLNIQIVGEINQADVAIAPLLRKILTIEEIEVPKHGTLIFHPSLLPRHRGPDAIKWAYKLGEKYTGVTWFLADEGLDTGEIAAQEVLAIPDTMKPRDFYEQRVIPAAERTLERIIQGLIQHGQIFSFPQREENATYESAIKREVAGRD
jgi:methionyl-tRNA formyltransferase